MRKDQYRDKVLIEKADGQQLGPVQALVQKGIIFAAPTHRIEVGDVLLREMPQGGHERYVVDDPGFIQGRGKLIRSHFQAEVHREDARRTSTEPVSTPHHQTPPTPPANITTINNNIHGDHGRLYQNSNDNSQTVINAIEPQLEALRTELRDKVEDPQRLADLEHEIDALKASRPDPSTIGERLDSLVRKGADMQRSSGSTKVGSWP